MALSMRYGAASDIGRSRKKNDDSGYAGPHFAMVADGMGGAPAGDLASAMTVQTMMRLDAPAPDDLLEALAGAVHRANDRLGELIEEDEEVDGMGTTVSAILFDGERVGLAYLGDSRGYLWRDGELLRITHDHTWVQSLIDEGRITEDEAKTHAHRSLLLKVLDGRHDNAPDLAVYDVRPGDRILLCSDGLSGFVEHERIERALSIGTASSAAAELVQLALDAASTDNITVVVADIVEEPPDQTAEPLLVGAATDASGGTGNRLRAWSQRGEGGPGEVLLDDADVDPEELRYAPRAPKRFRWPTRGLILLVVVAVVGVTGKLSYDWTQAQYYVAADGERVAIYQGVQADLPGVDLHHVREVDALTLAQLPSFRRSQVIEGMTAEDFDHAQAIVDQLHTFADACARRSASATATSGTATSGTETSRPRQTDKSSTGRRTTTEPTREPRESRRSTTSGRSSESTRTTGQDETGNESGGPAECSGATPSTESTR